MKAKGKPLQTLALKSSQAFFCTPLWSQNLQFKTQTFPIYFRIFLISADTLRKDSFLSYFLLLLSDSFSRVVIAIETWKPSSFQTFWLKLSSYGSFVATCSSPMCLNFASFQKKVFLFDAHENLFVVRPFLIVFLLQVKLENLANFLNFQKNLSFCKTCGVQSCPRFPPRQRKVSGLSFTHFMSRPKKFPFVFLPKTFDNRVYYSLPRTFFQFDHFWFNS